MQSYTEYSKEYNEDRKKKIEDRGLKWIWTPSTFQPIDIIQHIATFYNGEKGIMPQHYIKEFEKLLSFITQSEENEKQNKKQLNNDRSSI